MSQKLTLFIVALSNARLIAAYKAKECVLPCHSYMYPYMLKELCEKAPINKSTFYVYYHDVYDLSDKIENEVISEVVKNLDNTEEILTDPAGFAEKLFLGYSAQDSLISTIFAGTRAGQLPLKIEASLKETIYAHYPQYKDNIEFNIRLTYSIYGGYYAYNEYCKCGDERVTSIIGGISEKIMK